MEQLRKFFHLKTGDRKLLIHSFILLGLVRVGLWVLPFGTLQKFLAKINRTQYRQDMPCLYKNSELPTRETIAKAVNISSRYTPGGAKCLAKALTTQVLMNRYDYPSELRIGVSIGDSGEFQAHAWVESQGEIVIGRLTDLSRYIPMSFFQG